MRYTITKCIIDVIGNLWMPNILAAQRKELTSFDLEKIGIFTRNNVETWLSTNTGDFQRIKDFRVDFSIGYGEESTDWHSEWENPDSEVIFNELMYGVEDERF